jgi:cell division protein FtsL
MAKDMVVIPDADLKEEAESTRSLSGTGYATFVVTAVIMMGVAIAYVWSHNYMTSLEYQVAAEISKKESLLEDQKKLRIELATLKSPQRIAAIATEKLQMTYPQREQVVFLKDPGGIK